MTGPLTGVRLPATAKFQLATKSPLTGGYLCANSSGDFGPHLKKIGFDGLMIEGQSKDWIYLQIVDGKVKFQDAASLLGLGSFETQAALKSSIGSGKSSALSIGPAGERQVNLACISVDKRFFGRGGAGAVMGAKRLKEIAIRGSSDIRFADPKLLTELNYKAVENLKQTRVNHARYGTPQYIEVLNQLGCLPTRNFRNSYFEGADKIDSHLMIKRYWERNTACYMCPVACGKLNQVKERPFA